MADIINGTLIPFLGTTLGSACVFFLKGNIHPRVEKAFTGFAAGVMVAASFWSLLLPAIDGSARLGIYRFFPALTGLWLGFILMLLLDRYIPANRDGDISKMLFLAVTLHNVPEGMAVGVILAGLAQNSGEITAAAAFSLSLGIAIQNFPEGAIISLPLKAKGVGKGKAFLLGALSGAAEPVAAIITFLLAGFAIPLIPYFLAFAAGAMFYVVAEELLKESSHTGTVFFGLGLTLMMIIDCITG